MNASSRLNLHTGRTIPVIGLGTWKLTKDTADLVQEALEMGYRMVDTSGDYGTQPGVGDGIKQCNLKRDDLFIVTKVEENEDSYEATRKNLDELGVDYADLILIHRPPRNPNTSINLWEGLIRAQKEGLTRDIGVSNYTMNQMQELIDETGVKPVVNQIEWTPFGHSHEMMSYTQDNDILIQAYSPLTRGRHLRDDTLVEIAEHYKKTPAQVILRWDLQLGIVPIVKAGKPEHMRENLQIFDFELEPDDMATLNGLNKYESALGSLLAYT